MSRHLILHIGTPKTGSSAIQHFMATSRKALLKRGVAYPATPGSSNHSVLPLAVSYRDTPRKWANEVNERGLHAPAKIAEYWRQFNTEMESFPPEAETIVLSAERFAIHLETPEKIAYLHSVLAPHFASMRVVAYLRRQDAHATTAYSQTLRSGIIQPPSLAPSKSRYTAFYDYDTLLNNWSAAFGTGAIVPRVFERASLRNGDVLQDFLSLCGVEDMQVDKRGDTVRNPSLSVQGQSLLFAIGRIMQQQTGSENLSGRFWEELSDIVSATCAGPGWRPSRAEARAFLNTYAGSNEAVCKRWFPERAVLFDPDDSHLPEQPMTLDSTPDTTMISAILMEAVRRVVQAESTARLSRAKLALALGESAKAGVLLQKAVKLDGDSAEARLALARHMAEAGETKAAAAHVKTVLDANPKNRLARRIFRQINTGAI